MPKNLEVKIQVDNFSFLLDTLTKMGVEREAVLNQSDIYYENDKMKVKLRIEDGKSCLIKYIRDEINKERWSNYELLFLEGENPRKYLSDLLKEKTVVTKKRSLYLYKNTRIHLDEVEGLGNFIELETVFIDSDEDAVSRFNELVDILKLDLDKQIKCGYKELIEAK